MELQNCMMAGWQNFAILPFLQSCHVYYPTVMAQPTFYTKPT